MLYPKYTKLYQAFFIKCMFSALGYIPLFIAEALQMKVSSCYATASNSNLVLC